MDIKKDVEHLIGSHNTNNPFIIANNLNIILIYSDMKNTLGFFNKYKRSKFIHLNNKIPDNLKNFVCAHELGHAIRHADMNTPFLKSHTLFSTDKIEREANTFAVELLMPDSLVKKSECSIYLLAMALGIPGKLADLKK
ncbi:MAG TPA: ImmA/IrrE family metallo-endopeptidase [Methylomusa anaerophila]|uniref:Metallopeptidase ImmA n=1 Tax=Methylomusa anaerophila TaxID=1930071 RepID=A0A348AIW7_9FIRM|nr:ImmA/IrrE family metallo-endopeptidase [Methylomusa anaerophila]BBB91015.1 metallopeptidase ImmA [Methylomusa anaerophila]HML88886.1 ImmA/IrrE family metallo-endopeptidase [Methylomusa anaerophila]